MATSILSKSVVIGSGSSASGDAHRDTSKPPRLTNTVSTLLASEDRDGALSDNRNSDSTHSWKLTGQGAGFAGGFATRVEFGTEYKNDKGETVVPNVHITTDNTINASVFNVTSGGYDLSAMNLGAGVTGRVRVSVKQPS
jgi:hypothetical protein